MNSLVSIIAAMDEKRGIGKGNDLLFKIPEDFNRMQQITTGHPLIMGRKTFESLGRLLPNRTHIVITRNSDSLKHLSYQPHAVVFSIEEGIEKANDVILSEAKDLTNTRDFSAFPPLSSKRAQTSSSAPQNDNNEVFVFGGGQIFIEAIEKNLVDRLYLTIVKGDYGADTFFPDYSQFTKEINRQEGAWEDYKYSFIDLEKQI